MTAYPLTGIGWSIVGSPDEIVESLREQIERLLATLPEGDQLVLKATLDHASSVGPIPRERP